MAVSGSGCNRAYHPVESQESDGLTDGLRLKAHKILNKNQYHTQEQWRRGGDSNSRYPCEYAAFRVRCNRPLCHLSAVALSSAIGLIHGPARDDKPLRRLSHGLWMNVAANGPSAASRTGAEKAFGAHAVSSGSGRALSRLTAVARHGAGACRRRSLSALPRPQGLADATTASQRSRSGQGSHRGPVHRRDTPCLSPPLPPNREICVAGGGLRAGGRACFSGRRKAAFA